MPIPFDLTRPSRIHKLDSPLEEISGICRLSKGKLACVQDEKITIYQYDLSKRKTSSITGSYKKGDAEGIVVVDETAYILVVSNPPAVHRVTNFRSSSRKFRKHELPLSEKDNPEGFCHDGSGGLLIACKGPDGENSKQVYRVSTHDFTRNHRIKRSQCKRLFTVDSRDLRKKSSNRTFNPSGAAVDPKTGDLYLIGSRDLKMIVRYSRNGKRLKGKQMLDKTVFRQPEGIAFSKNGKHLYIASEKKSGKKARIFQFERQ